MSLKLVRAFALQGSIASGNARLCKERGLCKSMG